MRTVLLPAATALACGALAPTPALSQAEPSSPLIIDRNRADRVEPPPPHSQAAPQGGQVAVAPARVARPIASVRYEGADVPPAIAARAAPFVGRPASDEVLTALATAISDGYAASDIAFYTIGVRDIDPATGAVTIVVVRGFIESYELTGDARARSSGPLIGQIQRLMAERPLTKSTYQRQLTLMSEISGIELEASLRPGREAGALVLMVEAKRTRPTSSIGFNNFGSELLGSGTLEGSARHTGLFDVNDSAEIYYSGSTDLKRYNYIAGAYDMGIGADGLRVTATAGYLRTRVLYGLLTGDAKIAGVTLSYPLHVRFGQRLSASIGFDTIALDNAIIGISLTNDRTRTIRASLNYSQSSADAAAALNLTLSKGLDILDARGIAPLSQPSFTKLNLRGSYARRLSPRITARLNGMAQIARARLPVAEGIAVGGGDFGRGFENAVLSGDSGYALTGELAWAPDLGRRLSGTEFYIFAGTARLHSVRRGPIPAVTYDLASAGAGVRFQLDERLSANVGVSRTLDRPYPGFRDDWRLMLQIKLSLTRSRSEAGAVTR